jgi:hypothetical protein
MEREEQQHNSVGGFETIYGNEAWKNVELLLM